MVCFPFRDTLETVRNVDSKRHDVFAKKKNMKQNGSVLRFLETLFNSHDGAIDCSGREKVLAGRSY